jgi:hypothetical protein
MQQPGLVVGELGGFTGGKLPPQLEPDLSFPELALDSHLVGGARSLTRPAAAAGRPPIGLPHDAAGLMHMYNLQLAQLDGLHALLQQSGAQLSAAGAVRVPPPLPLPGTSADNPLPSVVIGMASPAMQQQAQQDGYYAPAHPPPVTTPALAPRPEGAGATPQAADGLMQPHFLPPDGMLAFLNANLGAPPAIPEESPPAHAAGGGRAPRGGRRGAGEPRAPRVRGGGQPRGPRARAPAPSPSPGEPPASTAERSSQFRGVTKHRRSGRFEAHSEPTPATLRCCAPPCTPAPPRLQPGRTCPVSGAPPPPSSFSSPCFSRSSSPANHAPP